MTFWPADTFELMFMWPCGRCPIMEYILIFIEAEFRVAKIQKQLNYITIDLWTKMWNMITKEYYSILKNKNFCIMQLE